MSPCSVAWASLSGKHPLQLLRRLGHVAAARPRCQKKLFPCILEIIRFEWSNEKKLSCSLISVWSLVGGRSFRHSEPCNSSRHVLTQASELQGSLQPGLTPAEARKLTVCWTCPSFVFQVVEQIDTDRDGAASSTTAVTPVSLQAKRMLRSSVATSGLRLQLDLVAWASILASLHCHHIQYCCS